MYTGMARVENVAFFLRLCSVGTRRRVGVQLRTISQTISRTWLTCMPTPDTLPSQFLRLRDCRQCPEVTLDPHFWARNVLMIPVGFLQDFHAANYFIEQALECSTRPATSMYHSSFICPETPKCTW